MNAIAKAEAGTPVIGHKNVFSALAAAQMEFGTVTKGATNPAFKSRYADLADVAAVVIPTLAHHGVAVLHYITGENFDRMRTEFVHGDSETKVACDVPLLVDRQNMQGMKSATTYAKRIGLESLSGVAPEDDDGNAAATSPASRQQRQDPPKAQIPQRITAEQFIALRDKAGAAGVRLENIAKAYKIASLEELPADAFDNAMNRLGATVATSKPKQTLADDEIPY